MTRPFFDRQSSNPWARTPPVAHAVRLGLMDALSQAERMAYENPKDRVHVYRRLESASGAAPSPAASEVSWRLFVRLATEDTPDGAQLLTTVSRKPPQDRDGFASSGANLSLAEAVRQVASNLPDDVKLADQAVVEYYPAPRRWGMASIPSVADRQVFAYQFLSTEGRNVATWIPDTATAQGVMMQSGFDGRGRPWRSGAVIGGKISTHENEGLVSIGLREVVDFTATPEFLGADRRPKPR